jgi:hypothetical protein
MSTATSTRHDGRRDHAMRWRRWWSPQSTAAASVSEPVRAPSRPAQIGQFGLHFVEMCVPMCIGFAIGDAIYFGLAGLAGYSKPFSELPELSVLVVTVSMTVSMTAWMLFRGMPRRRVIEMSAVMPVLALVLLICGWAGIIPMGDLALTEHGLMMPAMLVPMLLSLAFYTGCAHT